LHFAEEIMARLPGIKDGIGKLFGKGASAPATLQQMATIDAETTIISDTRGTLSELTPEQVAARNYAILAKVSHHPPAHERFLEFLKSTWRVVGPIAFIVFTAGEVYYYIKHFLTGDHSLGTQVLLWGITLLIEIPFAIATFDLSGRKSRAIEARRAGLEPPEKDTAGAVIMWFLMAAINISGQMAFLFYVTRAGSFAKDWPVYLFIGFRVIGVIVGDAYTAFFLSPAPTTIDHVIRHQKAQGDGFTQLTDQHNDRQIKESRAIAQIKQNQRSMKREESDADFIDQMHKMTAQAALRQQSRLLEIQGPEDD
jgi:hypothetical protein